MSKLDDFLIKTCEGLPGSKTLFERKGFCKKPNNLCGYCVRKGKENLCNKIKYTPILYFYVDFS